MKRNRLTLLAAAVALSALAACNTTSSFVRPAMELPEAWTDAPGTATVRPTDDWWKSFSDPTLDQLVAEAHEHNADLALAAARVDEARALAQVAGSLLYPAFDADFDRNRNRSSARSSVPLPPTVPLERNSYRAAVNVSYEVDLWGRLRSASAAARADLLSTVAARDTLKLALTAEVVRGYFALVSLDAQVEATRRALALRAQNLELQRIRSTAGLIGDYELRQLEAEVAAAQAQLPGLDRARTSQELGLAVLAGRSPRAIMGGTVARSNTPASPDAAAVPEGLPSDLLLQRPDIAEAEQRLIAASARIDAARAALFPRISLTGLYGSESGALSDLFSGPARIWQLAFGLAQPIWQAGRLQSEVLAIRAREQQAVAQYQKTVQQAFREVREALVTQARAREQFDAEARRAAALTETLKLARIRYDNGLSSQLEMLDAERSLLQAELNRLEALRAQRSAVADVVRALGGGWNAGTLPAQASRAEVK